MLPHGAQPPSHPCGGGRTRSTLMFDMCTCPRRSLCFFYVRVGFDGAVAVAL